MHESVGNGLAGNLVRDPSQSDAHEANHDLCFVVHGVDPFDQPFEGSEERQSLCDIAGQRIVFGTNLELDLGSGNPPFESSCGPEHEEGADGEAPCGLIDDTQRSTDLLVVEVGKDVVTPCIPAQRAKSVELRRENRPGRRPVPGAAVR